MTQPNPPGHPGHPTHPSHPPAAPRAAGRQRSPMRTFGITCLSLVGVAVLALATFGVLLYQHFTTPEYERGWFDQSGGYELVAEPCATLEKELAASMDASDVSANWETGGHAAVECAFTVTHDGVSYDATVGYVVVHQPMLFGRDRGSVLSAAYDTEHANIDVSDPNHSDLNNSQDIADLREIDGLGRLAKSYLVWAGEDESGYWNQNVGRLFSMVQVKDTNAVVTVQIEAGLPMEGVDAEDSGLSGESDLKDEISGRFAPPSEEVAEHSLVALTEG